MDGDGQKAGVGTWLLRLLVGAVLVFLIAPVIIIVVTSFSGSTLMSFPPRTWGLGWYRRFLLNPDWQRAIWVTLQVAPLATLMATVIGFFASLALIRGKFRGKTAVYGFLLTPMIVPVIISALAFYLAFAKAGATGSIFAMALGHAVLALPLVIIVLTSSLQGLDDCFERAALSLGAGRFYTLRRITLPLAMPGLISAALFAFLFSFDELLVSLFLAGAKVQTLTVRIWNSLQLDVDPTIAAVSTFLIAVTVLALVANALIRRSNET